MRNVRLIRNVDVSLLLAEVTDKYEFFYRDTSRQTKVPEQRETLTIHLRSVVKPLPPGVEGRDVHPSRRTRMYPLFPRVVEFVEGFAAETGGELCRATIVSLQPKGKVYRHYDRGEYYRIRDRYHLVLRSALGSVLVCADEQVRMREGELWWFDNKKHHEAANESDQPRIHVIFDVLPGGTAAWR